MWRIVLALGLIVAIWRVTRLLIIDEFPPVKATREWFVSTFGVGDEQGNLVGGIGPRWIRWLTYSLAYLWTCPWCMSVWVGAVLVVLAEGKGLRLDVPFPWLVVAAGSLVTGLGSQVESEHEQRYKIRQHEIDSWR
jgi:hypothetical protein